MNRSSHPGSVIASAISGVLRRRPESSRPDHEAALAHARASERRRFGADLEDTINNKVEHIQWLAETALQLLERPDAKIGIRLQLQHLTSTCRTIRTDLDDLLWAGNPENDGLDALLARLRTRARDLLRPHDIELALKSPPPGSDRPLRASLSRHVLLALTEALQDIVTHARPTKVTISLELKESHLRLAIQDNGSGSLGANNPGVAHALKTMRRRIEDELQGTVQIRSAPVGTKMDIVIPLADP